MGFGKLLGAKLKELNVSQADLADNVGLSRSTLNGIITRDTSKVEIETFLKICKYLKCDPEDFYDEYVKTRPKVQKQATPQLDKAQQRIVELFRDLTMEQKYTLIGRAEQMVSDNAAEYEKEESG